ncbi:hypothetical protein FACS189485_16140 [Spirochaetia bacterium]|nr:hypothetical protein FACS189485_16140 [Spirochaetia bacterium]
MRYISQNITDPGSRVWDCGSGYGTSDIFLAMNGINVNGTTIENYADLNKERFRYWEKFGDISLYTCSTEYFFDKLPDAESYDIILVQDTLHHLEPINQALEIFYTTLKHKGKVVSIEQNGDCLISKLQQFRRRGNRKIINYYDDELKKNIMMGDENFRGVKEWTGLFNEVGFFIEEKSIDYIRYFLPFSYNEKNAEKLLEKELIIKKRSSLIRKYFFFGLNFMAIKR